jgi:hypothetical protein
LPDAFFGIWNDNYWIGAYNGHYSPNFSGLIHWLAGDMGRVNLYAPLTALILGICAWVFFRRIGCNARASVLAAIAAALNVNIMSNAAWGLGTRGLSLGAAFLALAAVEAGFVVQPILTSVLAGLAIGLSITEGGDNGAIFSMFIAAYAFWRTWVSVPSRGKAIGWGLGKMIVMAVFAAIMASQTLGVFVRTSVKGVVGTEQDQQTKAQKWDFATQWSLPKIETLRVIIPGLFGYRMDTGEGGNYWGRVGEAPAAPQQMPRHSGAGEYAGVIVVLIALWGLYEALRGKGQTFSELERKLIAFWAVMAVVAMFLGWGRHAPFYQIVYALPYFSTIRNPMKFFHAFHLCVMILFAYGLIGFNRRFLDVPGKLTSLSEQLGAWWRKPSRDKTWALGSIAAVVVAVLAWFVYLGSRGALVKHLQSAGFPDVAAATEIARFSTHEALLFVVFLAFSVLIVTLVMSGAFAGARARWAAVLIGIVLVVDLARANAPWIIYYDWHRKYDVAQTDNILKDRRSSSAPVDFLRQAAPEYRVTMPMFQLNQEFNLLQGVYQMEWLQHHFPFYGIQTIDIPQEPRMPADKLAYRTALQQNLPRLWQLTSTRYLFGLAGSFPDMLNQQLDPVEKRFRIHSTFNLTVRPGITQPMLHEHFTTVPATNGTLALIEFTGALPKAKLYTDWEIISDEKALLARLADRAWDPTKSLLLSEGDAKPTATGTNASTAKIVRNPDPKLMEIETTSDGPAMLLLNDKLEPEWQAYVDGKQTPILRANYLMRAVPVPAGKHTVAFKYVMKPSGFYLVLGCELAAIALALVVWWSAKRRASTAPAPAAA